MNVEKGKLGTKLLSMRYDLPLVQAILSYVSSFGHYDDDELLIVVDVENGGYFIEQRKAV